MKREWVIFLALAGCAQQEPKVGEAAQKLGIARYDVKHSADGTVNILGLDESDKVIANVAVKYYRYEEFTRETSAANVSGQLRELSATMGKAGYTQESDASFPVLVPITPNHGLEEVLLDAPVQDTLKTLGITTRRLALPTERAYSGNCTNFPSNCSSDQSYHPANGPSADPYWSSTSCSDNYDEYDGYCSGTMFINDEVFYAIHCGANDITGYRMCGLPPNTANYCTPCGPVNVGGLGCAPCGAPASYPH
jgi:hypothetical protein